MEIDLHRLQGCFVTKSFNNRASSFWPTLTATMYSVELLLGSHPQKPRRLRKCWMPWLQQPLSVEGEPFLDKLFREELQWRRITVSPPKPLRVHAVCAVLEKRTLEFRPITHCSGPLSDSQNAHIAYDPFTSESFDDAIQSSKPRCYHADQHKSRLRASARLFLQITRFPPRYSNGPQQYYVNRFICSGFSWAPAIFQCTSSASHVCYDVVASKLLFTLMTFWLPVRFFRLEFGFACSFEATGSFGSKQTGKKWFFLVKECSFWASFLISCSRA